MFFPEPFLKVSEVFVRRWQSAYRDRLIREEVTSLESVSDLSKLELLAMALPDRVGSPLSLNSLHEDLQVQRWRDITAFEISTRQISQRRLLVNYCNRQSRLLE